jgi:hypothetical protein
LVLFALAGVCAACASDEPPDTLISPLPVSSPGVSPSPSPSPRNIAKVVTITITGEKIDVSESRVEVSLNQLIRIEVMSDRSEELHVHGYEKKTEIKAGKPAVLEFAADIPGVFEVELEKTHHELFELRVS